MKNQDMNQRLSERGRLMFLKGLDGEDEDFNYVTSRDRQRHHDGCKAIASCTKGTDIFVTHSKGSKTKGIYCIASSSKHSFDTTIRFTSDASDDDDDDTDEIDDYGVKRKSVEEDKYELYVMYHAISKDEVEPKGICVVELGDIRTIYFTCMKKGSKVHTLHFIQDNMTTHNGRLSKSGVFDVLWPSTFREKAASTPRFVTYRPGDKFVYMVSKDATVWRSKVGSRTIEIYGRVLDQRRSARNLCFGYGAAARYLIVTGMDFVAVFDVDPKTDASRTGRPIFKSVIQNRKNLRRLCRTKPFRNDLWFEGDSNKYRKVCMIDGTMILLHSYGLAVLEHDFLRGGSGFFAGKNLKHVICRNYSGCDPHDMIPLSWGRRAVKGGMRTAKIAVTLTGTNKLDFVEVPLMGDYKKAR
eukprot:g3147.t1